MELGVREAGDREAAFPDSGNPCQLGQEEVEIEDQIFDSVPRTWAAAWRPLSIQSLTATPS